MPAADGDTFLDVLFGPGQHDAQRDLSVVAGVGAVGGFTAAVKSYFSRYRLSEVIFQCADVNSFGLWGNETRVVVFAVVKQRVSVVAVYLGLMKIFHD